MNISIRSALYIAGAILLTSAIVSQFQNSELRAQFQYFILAIERRKNKKNAVL